jgi:hypothetical protein
MESSIPPTKSEKQSGAPLERLHKKKMAETIPKPTSTEFSEPHQTTSILQTEQTEQEPTIVLPKSTSSRESKIDVAMRNQIYSSRAITVEIDTLRDLMPKLRKEIQTYSINECQLIKELEKKLPSCQEHKDVRLNLVLEEIQRLRLNRRRTLAKLKESIVKVVELQSRMEITSYEAGEIFWDGKISRLTDEKYQELDIFTPVIEEKDSKKNFNPAPVSHFMADGQTMSISVNPTTQSQTSKQSEQGYLTELARDVNAAHAESKKISNPEQKLVQKNSTHELYNINNPSPRTEQIESQTTENDILTSQSNVDVRGFESEHRNDIDFEKVVAEAQKQAERSKIITRRGILIAVVPPAAVASLLILDWLTGIFSRSLGSLFGG